MHRLRFYFVNIFTVILVGCFVDNSEASKILAVFSSPSKSHVIVEMAAIKPLIERGHDLTVITSIPLKESEKSSLRHIHVPVPEMDRDHMKKMIESSNETIFTIVKRSFGALQQMAQYGDKALKDERVQKLMKEEKFDLVILGYFISDFQMGLAAHFKCPLILIWTSHPMRFLNTLIGNPNEYLYVPALFTSFPQPMNFLQRVANSLFIVPEELLEFVWNRVMESYYVSHFPPEKYPSFSEVRKTVSLVFVNHHFSQGVLRPNVPAVVEIGGIQIKEKPNPLPMDVKKFLDASVNGAIYFSLGSNARSSELNPKTTKMLFKVFSELKQNVLWKWEDDVVPGKSDNIKYGKWFPQDDILANPNVKLFITHGGKGGVTEAEYHGVPMIGFPLFAEQEANVKTFEKLGFGIGLNIKTLEEDKFRSAVKEILENKSYSMEVEKFSKIYRDRPLTARESVAFWTEYVIRHKGAKHMESPLKHLNPLQRLGLDVLVFILGVIYVFVKFMNFVFKSIWKLLCRRKLKKE